MADDYERRQTEEDEEDDDDDEPPPAASRPAGRSVAGSQDDGGGGGGGRPSALQWDIASATPRLSLRKAVAFTLDTPDPLRCSGVHAASALVGGERRAARTWATRCAHSR